MMGKKSRIIYVIADTHFFHGNIIKLTDRPIDYQNIIRSRWNGKVDEDDLIIIIGDYSLGRRIETIYFSLQLRGQKILILGNHDKFSRKAYIDMGFLLVCERIDIAQYILTHVPLAEVPANKINVHGHIHRKSAGERHYNAGVEANDYSPIELNTIR